METYLITAQVDFEVEANSKEEAISYAEQGMGDIAYFKCKSVLNFGDEVEE